MAGLVGISSCPMLLENYFYLKPCTFSFENFIFRTKSGYSLVFKENTLVRYNLGSDTTFCHTTTKAETRGATVQKHKVKVIAKHK